MITITISKGTGDKPINDYNDEWIVNSTLAKRKAIQIINDSFYSRKQKTIKIPYQTGLKVGDIYQNHVIKTINVSYDFNSGLWMELNLEGEYK